MKRQGGASRFEFAVCMLLVALLAGGLLIRLLDVREESERAAAHHVAGALRTALAARVARMEEDAQLAKLAGENPMHWLSRLPPNYLGEYYSPDLAGLRKGSWYFDRTDKSINYLFSRDTFSRGTSKLLKFKVEFMRSPRMHRNDRLDGDTRGLALLEIDALNLKQH
ncbi:hypothetical protein [Massilia sp. ST3]|uniref:hypothetical protein n=1 Tax=Massilia sp. ST3 TaxID=2824903 RepID=UPI001B81C41A|nr:hypothetical protein [Massilia sp. ST3]MBQ5947586.1 hypothetical protein [Massilia sp. ST3]